MNKLILPLMMYRESGDSRKGTKKYHRVVPTWNHLYTIVRRTGKVFLDYWATQHKAKIEVLTRNWMEENDWKTTENRKVYVDVWVYFPDAKLRDCHNLDKIILDAFEDAELYDNDANALLRYQDFDIDAENPRIEVAFTVGPYFNRQEIVDAEKEKIKEAEREEKRLEREKIKQEKALQKEKEKEEKRLEREKIKLEKALLKEKEKEEKELQRKKEREAKLAEKEQSKTTN